MELILLRHGQSQWNKLNLFTGWEDVDLSEKGIEEAKNAGELLKQNQSTLYALHTSTLRRAIQTSFYCLEVLDQLAVPTTRNWRLNERHYGALQGKNKDDMKKEYGEEQVHIWRRSYDIRPPEKTSSSPLKWSKHICPDLDKEPSSESLKDTLARVLPYWNSTLKPQVQEAKKIQQTVLIVAHGNSLRALVQHLTQMSAEEILAYEIATGTPIAVELENNFERAKNIQLLK